MTSGSVRASVLVLAVGNTLLGDDGAGVAMLAELDREAGSPHVELLDGGTQGLGLLSAIAGRRGLIILDAVALGAEPGTVHVLRDWRQAARHSSTAHEMNVAELIQTSTLLGECPEQITVVGIEPDRVETGVGLSPAVSRSISAGASTARNIIREQLG